VNSVIWDHSAVARHCQASNVELVTRNRAARLAIIVNFEPLSPDL
jgi:hypothetical protein